MNSSSRQMFKGSIGRFSKKFGKSKSAGDVADELLEEGLDISTKSDASSPSVTKRKKFFGMKNGGGGKNAEAMVEHETWPTNHGARSRN